MHHDVADALLDLLSGLKAGPPRSHAGPFWTAALDGWSRGDGPLEMRFAGGLDLAEEDPPAADRIVAINRGARPVVAYPGDVIGGGFATRAVVDAALVPPGEERRLGVEAIDARWWPRGPLLAAGSLDPLPALALELARRPRGDGLAAVARTTLWSMMAASPPPDAGDGKTAPPLPARGWVLGDAVGVIGAALFRHHRLLRGLGPAPAGEDLPDPGRRAPDRVHRYLGEIAVAVARSRAGAASPGLRPMVAGGVVLGLAAVRLEPDAVLRLARGVSSGLYPTRST